MIVLDTSAALSCLVGTDTDPDLRSRVNGSGSLHVPHLFDVEVLSGLRGLVLGGKLSEDRAADGLADFGSLRLVRYPVGGLAAKVWSRRHTMTAYDAVFVSLAEALGCPMVTCDRRLARAATDIEVEFFPSIETSR